MSLSVEAKWDKRDIAALETGPLKAALKRALRKAGAAGGLRDREEDVKAMVRTGVTTGAVRTGAALERSRSATVTMGKPVIMGRKTWDSLPRRPLVGRGNIVLSRDAALQLADAVVCDDFAGAVAIGEAQAAERGVGEVCVIGGASLFALALERAHRIYLTDVDADVAGDVVLPPIDERHWREVRREAHPASADNDHPFTIRVLER